MLDSVESVIDEIKIGRPVIVMDAKDRENEGDLVIAAGTATKENINFIIQHTCGIICLALSQTIADRLKLTLQPRRNVSECYTAFTTSIDAKNNITTGMSAHDRAHTIRIAASTNSLPDDIQTPGHVFPIIASKGGVLERAGHTEASVELADLAGLEKAAVVCEIIDPLTGSAATRKQLIEFSRKHNLKICSIAQIIEFKNKILLSNIS